MSVGRVAQARCFKTLAPPQHARPIRPTVPGKPSHAPRTGGHDRATCPFPKILHTVARRVFFPFLMLRFILVPCTTDPKTAIPWAASAMGAYRQFDLSVTHEVYTASVSFVPAAAGQDGAGTSTAHAAQGTLQSRGMSPSGPDLLPSWTPERDDTRSTGRGRFFDARGRECWSSPAV